MVNMIGPIPQIGFGTWKRSGDEGYREVLTALEVGYRHIDTAEAYGNEEDVGRALQSVKLPRQDIFITTKVAPENLGPGQVRPHVLASLDKLQLTKVDLLLVHWPSTGDRYDINDYMSQFAEVQDQGLATHIGVSNFTKRHLASALQVFGTRPIVTNQVEIHPLFQNRIIVDHCRTLGIPLTAYSPLARGAVNESPVITAIAKQHGATAGQVSLAFLMAEGHIVIPTSSNKTRMAENIASTKLQLSQADMAKLRQVDEGRRLVNGGWAPKWDA
jgi:2,5-diketo-D-gluconate reductase B